MADHSSKTSALTIAGFTDDKLAVHKCRVLIADDHILVAQALQRLLEDYVDQVGAVYDGYELLTSVMASKPDLVLVDIGMPTLHGNEAARRIRQVAPKTKIIALTMRSEREYVAEAMRAGASGYVLKTCTLSELMTAIQRVLAGQLYLTPSIEEDQLSIHLNGHPCHGALTVRQREVLRLVAEGLTAKEIAKTLNVSVKTAVFHKGGLMEKLGLHTTAALTRYALEHGFICCMSEGASVGMAADKVQREQHVRAASAASAR